jgi:hypothetical protein
MLTYTTFGICHLDPLRVRLVKSPVSAGKLWIFRRIKNRKKEQESAEKFTDKTGMLRMYLNNINLCTKKMLCVATWLEMLTSDWSTSSTTCHAVTDS